MAHNDYLLEGKNTERGRRRTYKVRNNNPATVIQINMYCTTSGFVPKSILSSSRSATHTEKHEVGFEGSLHYYCGKSTVFCFAHLFFQGFNGYGTAYSCSRLLFYYFFFSHLQRKESESTAKNPMTVAYYLLLFAITLKNIVRAVQITAIRSPVLLLCFSNLRFRPAVNMRMALVRRVLNMSIPLQTFSHPLL